MKETRTQREKRQHNELMNNIIEVRQYDYTEGYKIVVRYASGATRTFRNEPSWLMEYIEDSWSIMQEAFNVYGSYEQIHNNYKPVEFSTPEEVEKVEETSLPAEIAENAAAEHPQQQYTSANTSINSDKIPAVFSTLAEKANKLNIILENSVVFDTGCGKYPEVISDFFKASNTDYIGRDKFNQPENINNQWVDNCKAAGSVGLNRIFTSSNVLNVIKGEKFRVEYLADILQYMKKGEKLYITVYPGDCSGIGRPTNEDCWQENRKYKDYIPECLKAGFTTVTPKYNMLICEL